MKDIWRIVTFTGALMALMGVLHVPTSSPQVLAASGGIYSRLLALQSGKTESSKKKLQAYELKG